MSLTTASSSSTSSSHHLPSSYLLNQHQYKHQQQQEPSSSPSSTTPTITSTLIDTQRFYCPFLQRGFCREASKCKFSHDNIGSIKIPNEYCHFYLANQCLHGSECKFRHSEPIPEELECDLCGRTCLHPYDLEQQRQHREDCLREHEREMELSFAVQRSKDKVCGICMDTVVEKKSIASSRFGILEKCNHIFCLDCIRKWRGTKQFETRTIRACPECRVSSDFVVPSKYWIEDQDDKDKLINDYKAALRLKPCKYFNEGKGDCPFAGSCFYKHAYPDGRIAKLGAPKPRRRIDGEAVANLILWNILTSTDDDDWSNEDVESLYPDLDFGWEDEYDDVDYDDEDDDDDIDDDDDEDDNDEDHLQLRDRIFDDHLILDHVRVIHHNEGVDNTDNHNHDHNANDDHDDDDEDEDEDQEEEEEGWEGLDDLVA